MQKMANLQKSKYLLRNLIIKQKMHTKNCANYTFLKSPWPSEFKCANNLQKYKNLNVCLRKTENVQIPFKGVCAKLCNLVAFVVGFPKSYEILKYEKKV